MTILSDNSPTIVIDNGSYSCKIGFSNDETPKIIPTLVGSLRRSLTGQHDSENTTYIGKSAQNRRGILKLKYPIQRGQINNWESMEKIWRHAFDYELMIEPSEHQILIAIPPNTNQKQRDKIDEIFTETFQVQSVNFHSQSQLSLLSAEISTGVVVDLGEGQSHIIPCYENEIIEHAASNFAIAGCDITEELKKKFDYSGIFLPTKNLAAFEIVREIKENCACLKLSDEIDDVHYEMPDGQIIYVGKERHESAEILFNPQLNGTKSEGLHSKIYETILKCDETIQNELFKNILLVGGTSNMEGLKERLENELKVISLKNAIKIKTTSYGNLSSWVGGSIYASQFLKTKSEYE